jgi:hypothetical protein
MRNLTNLLLILTLVVVSGSVAVANPLYHWSNQNGGEYNITWQGSSTFYWVKYYNPNYPSSLSVNTFWAYFTPSATTRFYLVIKDGTNDPMFCLGPSVISGYHSYQFPVKTVTSDYFYVGFRLLYDYDPPFSVRMDNNGAKANTYYIGTSTSMSLLSPYPSGDFVIGFIDGTGVSPASLGRVKAAFR